MRFPPQHKPLNQEVKCLIDKSRMLTLLTGESAASLEIGLYNFIFHENSFWIHLGRTDEQTKALQRDGLCKVMISEQLSVIPSHWIDKAYGGAANQFFRYADFKCSGRIVTDFKEMQSVLQIMLDQYQPERGYADLDPKSEVYASKFQMIVIIELKIESQRAKWNLGQTKPREAYENIIVELKKRNQGLDFETAEAMIEWRDQYF